MKKMLMVALCFMISGGNVLLAVDILPERMTPRRRESYFGSGSGSSHDRSPRETARLQRMQRQESARLRRMAQTPGNRVYRAANRRADMQRFTSEREGRQQLLSRLLGEQESLQQMAQASGHMLSDEQRMQVGQRLSKIESHARLHFNEIDMLNAKINSLSS